MPSRSVLLAAQNTDGGWGYFPGKQSWLEPTGWAALALHGHPASERAYRLVRNWQASDGSCRPAAGVDSPHWTASLVVMLAALRKDLPVMKRGVRHLLETMGSESGPFMRVLHYFDPNGTDREPKFEGWPWRPGAAAWIEPTVHGITALRMAAALLPDVQLQSRIASAQNLIWHQRCRGGGWNYGARVAREIPLPPYSETTALALIGLLGRPGLAESIETARTLELKQPSPLGGAWLSVSLRMHGAEAGHKPRESPNNDTMVAAIAEIGAPQGNWRLLLGRTA